MLVEKTSIRSQNIVQIEKFIFVSFRWVAEVFSPQYMDLSLESLFFWWRVMSLENYMQIVIVVF
jgi:hypothetical protein